MDINAVGKQFLEVYYTTIMKNKENLLNFYSDNSIMTYNGSTYRGLKQITQKIQSFSFQNIQYQIDNQDVQEGPIQGSMVIFVHGALRMDQDNPFKFSQVFIVCPNGQGGYYCHNDICSLVL